MVFRCLCHLISQPCSLTTPTYGLLSCRGKKKEAWTRTHLLLGISSMGPHSLPEAQVLFQVDQAPSPHHPNLSRSWSTAEITSRTSPSQALSLRACHVGQVPVMSQRGSNNPQLWPGDRGADPQHRAQLQLMPLSPRPLAQQRRLDTANHKVGHASPAGGLAFSDELPCHFCCPKFHLQGKVGLLWKSLHRQGWEEFLGEQANPSAAVSLLQGCVAAQQHLAYTGWGYPSFQTWVTQVRHYKRDPTFKCFPSRSGFSLCASGVAFVN